MPTIVHFEIPVDEPERARQFYTALFDWKIEQHEESTETPMEYWTITTTDDQGKEALGGGMMRRNHPQQPITNYIGVPSVEEYVRKVESLGGQVVFPRSAVPGMGYFAVCLDTECNAFALWEEDRNAQ